MNVQNRLVIMQSLLDQANACLDSAMRTYEPERVLSVFFRVMQERSLNSVPEDMKQAYNVAAMTGMAMCIQRILEAMAAEA